MLTAKQLESDARLILSDRGFHEGDESYTLAERLLIQRSALVCMMVNMPFMSQGWMACSKQIADVEERLAKFGLV